MSYYSTCPNCGSNLDPSERCDCQKQKQEKMVKNDKNANLTIKKKYLVEGSKA